MVYAGGQAGLFIIFPFFVATGIFAALGIFLIFAGIFLVFLGIFEPMGSEEMPTKAEKRALGLVLIGPVPLVIDTRNKRLSAISIAVFIILILILIIFFNRI